VMYGKINGEWSVQQQYVELSTKFSENVSINTGNQPGISAFPIPSGYVNTQHPDLQNISALYEAHLAIMQRHGGGMRPIMELQSKYNGDIAKYLAAGMNGELSKAAEAGCLRLKQIESDQHSSSQVANPYQSPAPDLIDQASMFVATLPGAFRITWNELWPIKQIVAGRKYARDRKIRKEAGFLR